jgi:hypothetical protein
LEIDMNKSTSQTAFISTIAAFATLAPMALVVYAFVTYPDSIDRAWIVVQGCEGIVAILVAAVTLRIARHLRGSMLANQTPAAQAWAI